MKLHFYSAGIKWYIRETNSSNFLLMYFGGGFGFTRWMVSQWNHSAQTLFVTCICTHISFNFKTNWLLLMRVCSPNPQTKYLQYLQTTHFFSPLSTDLILPHQFTRQFYNRALAPTVLMTTEPPEDCDYPPGWHLVPLHQWKQCPPCPRG